MYHHLKKRSCSPFICSAQRNALRRLPSRIAALSCIALIRIIRPLLGPASCRYLLSCTDFAAQELTTKPFLTALRSVAQRVLACNPVSAWLYKRQHKHLSDT